MKSTNDQSRKFIDSEERYRRLFEAAQDGILILDATTGKIVDANPFISKLTGYSINELIDKYIWDLGFIKNILANQDQFLELQKTGYARYETLPIETKSGETLSVEFISNVYLVGDIKVIQCNIRDITNRVYVERLNRELRMMYDVIILCNRVLLHESTANSLIDQMCKVLISSGGFRASWVSDALVNSKDLIKPRAAEGVENDYFDLLNLGIEGKTKSLVVTAVRLHKLLICQDLQKEEKNTLMHQYYVKQGLRSVAVIPIKSQKNTPYVMVVYGKNPQELTEDLVTLLKDLAGEIAFGVDTLNARTEHLKLVEQVESNLSKTIVAIASMLEQRDPYTAGHQRRVADLAVAIATEMGLSPAQITGLRMASVVHDIGKIHVPAEILSKPGALTDAEYEIIKTHPKGGWEVLKNIDFSWPVAEMVYQHHERLDGSGYPRGLKDKDILLETRILMVADVMDSMAAHRPYRPALGIMAALQEILQQKGKLFDERVVDACVKLFMEKNYEIK